MSLSKIKSEILKLKEVAQKSSSPCHCKYVEIEEGQILPSETLLIIDSNRKCRSNQNIDHVGYSVLIINSMKSVSE